MEGKLVTETEKELEEYKQELLEKSKEDLIELVIQAESNASYWSKRHKETDDQFIDFIKTIEKEANFSKWIKYSEHDYVSSLKSIYETVYGEIVSKKVKI